MSAYDPKPPGARFAKRSALGLNNWSLTFTNRCFALATAREAEGENDRADQNEELFHQTHPEICSP